MVNIYTEGSCMNFFQILHSIYPEAEAYYNGDHIITKIGNNFYDINGVVYKTSSYGKYTDFHRKSRLSRVFKQMSY